MISTLSFPFTLTSDPLPSRERKTQERGRQIGGQWPFLLGNLLEM